MAIRSAVFLWTRPDCEVRVVYNKSKRRLGLARCGNERHAGSGGFLFFCVGGIDAFQRSRQLPARIRRRVVSAGSRVRPGPDFVLLNRLRDSGTRSSRRGWYSEELKRRKKGNQQAHGDNAPKGTVRKPARSNGREHLNKARQEGSWDQKKAPAKKFKGVGGLIREGPSHCGKIGSEPRVRH
jgi:hypothetical protein